MGDPSQFRFQTDATAEAYEQLLVPRLFTPWAERLVSCAALSRGDCVIDVATGPGTVARLAARAVGKEGSVWATDLSPNMLRVARARTAEPGAAEIRFVECPADRLVIADGVAHAVFCQQGLQFFPDQSRALREMHRVLRPGGRVAIAVWGSLKLNTLYAAWHEALDAAGLTALAELLTAPFSLPDARIVEGLVRGAGFVVESVVVEARPLTLEGGMAQTVGGLAATAVGEPLRQASAEAQERYVQAAQLALAPLLRGDVVQAESSSTVLVAHA
jgi:ubiquinone/menaquinone biosynthesis C-methylase UbiE